MRTGDVITARINGHRVTMLLDDHVLPDRTCGQYDEGFWAYDPAEPDDAPAWFLSRPGTGRFTHPPPTEP